MTLSAEDRERGRQLCERAAPEPWVVSGHGIVETRDGYNGKGPIPVASTANNAGWTRENAAFIVFSREAIPAYEAALAEKERELAEARALLQVSDLSAENQRETAENGAFASYDERRAAFLARHEEKR